MLDRLQEVSAQVFEAAAKRRVEREFEAARQRGAHKMPVTGDEIYPDASPEQQAELVNRAVQALLARKWFEGEAPPWALPLPLSDDEIVELLNGVHQGKHRPRMRSHYGRYMRSRGWSLEHVTPFELYFAQG